MDRVLKAARASGSLNLSNRSLSDVPSEVYRSLDAVQADEKWWEAVELHKLILAHNNIQLLDEELRNLSSLTVLNVSHNKLSELPAAIGELPVLKLLDVSFNSLMRIPEEIGSATSLNEERLLWKLGTLPPGLMTFYGLTYSLEKYWHVLGLGYNPNINPSDIENAAVIHYNGNRKPWMEMAITKYRPYWTKYIDYDHPYLSHCHFIK